MKRDYKLPSLYIDRYPSDPAWETPPPTDEILSILNQPFSYFSHGNQTIVFLSQDGQYVLKLFRYKRSLFPILHSVKNLFKKKPKLSLSEKLHKTFSAVHLAYTKASPFTQVVYCHLNLTQNLLPTLKHPHIPLDQSRFVLQRKVSPFKETLLAAKNDPEKMDRLLTSFIDLLLKRSALGISNSDPNLAPNFGFLGEQAVELDFGNYHTNTDSTIRKQEITNLLNRFEEWLGENAPEYVKNLRLKKEIAYIHLNEPSKSIH